MEIWMEVRNEQSLPRVWPEIKPVLRRVSFVSWLLIKKRSPVDIAHVGLTARHGRIWCHPLKPCALTKLPPMINELDARSRNSIHQPHRHLHHNHLKKAPFVVTLKGSDCSNVVAVTNVTL